MMGFAVIFVVVMVTALRLPSGGSHGLLRMLPARNHCPVVTMPSRTHINSPSDRWSCYWWYSGHRPLA